MRSIKSKNMEALTTKLKHLKLAVSRTESIIVQQNEVVIERHLSALEILSVEAENLKWAVEEHKLPAKEDLEEVNKWNDSVDTKILKDSIKEFRQPMQLKKQEKESRYFKWNPNEILFKILLTQTKSEAKFCCPWSKMPCEMFAQNFNDIGTISASKYRTILATFVEIRSYYFCTVLY